MMPYILALIPATIFYELASASLSPSGRRFLILLLAMVCILCLIGIDLYFGGLSANFRYDDLFNRQLTCLFTRASCFGNRKKR